jgi:murein DD-endopeptidase MepM/ murein hydrolase activator NlpD
MRLNRHKIIKFFILILLYIIIPNLIFPPLLTAEPLDDELSKIKSEKEETQKKLEDIKKEESAYIEEVNDIEGDLLSALDELGNLNVAISEKKSNIDKTTVDLISREEAVREIEEKLNQKLEVFNRRIVDIYKNGDINILEVLLRSGDFIELVSRLKMMNLVAKQDAQAISEIKEDRQLLIDAKKKVIDARDTAQREKDEFERLLESAESKTREMEEIYSKKKELLSVTRENKEALILLENQLHIKELEITRALESYNYGSAPTGRLLWPVAGKISSGFGYRTSPLSGSRRFHSGVDLYAPSGTPIYACEGGQVLKAEYHGGYGYSILIYHGGSFATFYAHLSGFAVGVGQNVSRGELIGYVGTTGYTTGPHLHLEVRVNGQAQDPMNYL